MDQGPKRPDRALRALAAAGLLALLMAACQPTPAPMPGNSPPAILAVEMAEEFHFNPVRAVERYVGHWYTVTAGPVAKVRRGTAHVPHRGDFITLSFYDGDQTQDISRNGTITAVCMLDANVMKTNMYFRHCRWPGSVGGEIQTPANGSQITGQSAAGE